jgi:hypothetical protein
MSITEEFIKYTKVRNAWSFNSSDPLIKKLFGFILECYGIEDGKNLIKQSKEVYDAVFKDILKKDSLSLKEP